MKCIQCNNEFKPTRKTAKFCSSKCRMAFNYKLALKDKEVSVDKAVVSVEKDSVDRVSVKNKAPSVPLSPVITDKDLKDYTAQDLYDAIDSYHSDAWVYSPEFKELKRRLDVWSVPKLESLGYRVPNWKFNEV